MHIVHGSWIPDAADDYIRRGGLYLWVETDRPVTLTSQPPGTRHPRHLHDQALTTFLIEKLGIEAPPSTRLDRLLVEKLFLLPSAHGMPLPSYELAPYVDEELPEQMELAPWQVCCFPLPVPIATLHNLTFLAWQEATDFQLGTDLVFWHQVTQALRGVIIREEYVPAVRYRQIVPATAKRRKRPSGPHGELWYGWDWVSEEYETIINDYAACMPPACAAGSAREARGTLYDTPSLLRHAAECLLNDIVRSTPFPAKFEQQIAGTLLARCLSPSLPAAAPTAEEWEEARLWTVWHKRLVDRETEAAFRLGLRLLDAPPDDPDHWRMEFLVTSKQDPSLQLRLDDFGNMDDITRAATDLGFGKDFQKHLLLSLGYAARIYPDVRKGLHREQPSSFPLSLEEAFAFLTESAWVLQDAGYTVMVPAWWTPQGRRRAKIRLKTSMNKQPSKTAAPQSYLSLESIVNYHYQLSIGEETVTEEEWEQLVSAKSPLVLFRGQWMALDRERMQQMLTFWRTRQQEQPEMSLLDMLQTDAQSDDIEWDHDQALSDVLDRLQDKSRMEPAADPPDFHGNLREYQRRGVAWLQYLESLGLNPCLADDMGLGKTVQVIARLAGEKAAGLRHAPTLLIAPTSVLGNWRKEVERFAPSLRTLIHQGSDRCRDGGLFKEAVREVDIVVTSFALARLDEKLLRGMRWHRVVVDEAQNIKNPQAAVSRAIQKLDTRHRVALTGTPVENRLRDLWSIFHFLNPGYLGKEAQFRKTFELPIQKENDQETAATLKKLVEPLILRRVKTDKTIIDDLPEKVEQTLYCNLTPEQASLYEAVVRDVDAQLNDAEGIGRRGIMLATLTRLKQICNHPAQYLQDGSAFSSERSLKLQQLTEMADEALESGDSMLIFTQFTDIGEALERHLRQTLRCPIFYLHGGTSMARRDQMVATFQDPATQPAIFVLSLRAGGTGITLTKASRVFHFDRWWNPAVEDQATDRAFRIGQRHTVFVYKFVAIGTVDERIDTMIEEKKRVASAIVGSDESWLTELDNETFKRLIALRPGAVAEAS